MKRVAFVLIVFAGLFGVMLPMAAASASETTSDSSDASDATAPDHDWQSVFNGRNLLGWQKRDGHAHFWVDDEAIVGETVAGSPTTFLCTDRKFGDFVLRFEVKFDGEPVNSGFQVRSKVDPDRGRVIGPQVEIEGAPGETGYIYAAGQGHWHSPEQPKKDVMRNDGWNSFKVRAEGDRIRTWVNGTPVADVSGPDIPRRGFLALQVHYVPEGEGPYRTRFRNIQLRELE